MRSFLFIALACAVALMASALPIDVKSKNLAKRICEFGTVGGSIEGQTCLNDYCVS
jgi:hypothetical protein